MHCATTISCLVAEIVGEQVVDEEDKVVNKVVNKVAKDIKKRHIGRTQQRLVCAAISFAL